MSITTIPKLIKNSAEKWPEIAAQYSKDESGTFCPTSFAELMDRIYNVSAGLLSLGIKRADCVGLIADNRKEWLQSSMGIMAIGAADVPRGCDATLHELSYILSFTECVNVIAENTSQAEKVLSQKEHLPVLKRIISFDPISDECKAVAKKAKVEILLFDELIAKGKEWREKNPQKVEEELEKGTGEELACIIFTSGTTGVPKGVMLSHSNFLAQLVELPERIYLNPGEKALSVLPVWHSFERSCEYVVLLQGSAVCYSKPIGSIMLPDFQALNPQIIPAVPRVFEAVYEGVNRSMRKTGGIVLALYQFFTAVAICHARAERTLFNKTARFKKQNDILRRIALVFPWVFLYPLKALGSVIIFKKIRAKLGNDFRGGVSGGGALPPAVDEFFWAIGINLVEGYGLTETSPVVSVRPFYDPVFGTIGKPLRG
ncbi:MAG: AMP-binding protein, partial [Spirochaetales bacterium]